MSELKPCPFCGSEANLETLEGYCTNCMNNPDDYAVQCNDCVSSTDRYSVPEEAIKAWNTRATPPEDKDNG